MPRRIDHLLLLGLACAAVALGALVPPAARADGDPASDLLISQDVFYPYAPNAVAKPLQTALNGMVRAAKAKGYPVKIALIADQADLGSVPQLFTDPQKYADLLTAEISYNTKPRVLVVLPAGLGGNNLGDRAGPALAGVTVDQGAGPDGLARAALAALGKLTAANGTPVAVPKVAAGGGSRSGGGASPLLVFGVPVLLVGLAAGFAVLRGRDEDDEEAEDGDDAPPDGDAPASQ